MPGRLIRRSEAGVTLIELLVSMTVGLLVISVALGLVTSSQGASKKISDRVDAGQRGRVALDQITQRLRAASCLDNGFTPPIVYADANRITFYADLDGDTTFDPEQRSIEFESASSAPSGLVREDRWAGLAVPLASPAPARTSTRNILTDFDALPGREYLRYYALSAASPAIVTELPVPLTGVDRVRVARIDITFRARPTEASTYSANTVAMSTSVYARTPQSSATGPRPTFSCA